MADHKHAKHGPGKEVVVQDTDLEQSRRYRPAKWQSNVTIISCVRAVPLSLSGIAY